MRCHGCNAPDALAETVADVIDYTTHMMLPGLMVVLHDVKLIGPCATCKMQWIELAKVGPLIDELQAIHRRFVDRVDCHFDQESSEWKFTLRLRGKNQR